MKLQSLVIVFVSRFLYRIGTYLIKEKETSKDWENYENE